MVDLKLNGLVVPLLATLSIEQTYPPISARARFRMADGHLEQQVAWSGKIGTQLTCSGQIPPGLQAIDYDQPITLSCIARRAITSAANIIALPATRRADAGAEPTGLALLPMGRWERTAAVLVGDTATLDPVAGALQYQALYYPEFSGYFDEPTETKQRGARWQWTLIGEEI